MKDAIELGIACALTAALIGLWCVAAIFAIFCLVGFMGGPLWLALWLFA